MFDTLETARDRLAQYFDEAEMALVVPTLSPAIHFGFGSGGADRVGGTRIGGLPDLPMGQAWPVPDYPPDIGEIVTRGSPTANAELQEHIARRPPFAFVAQIDLAEARALGDVAGELPAAGRLLFFYDMILGPYANAAWLARVIWDQSPTAALAPLALPPSLETAAAERRRVVAEYREQMRGIFDDDDDIAPSPAETGTPYAAPGRAAALKIELRPPAAHAIEMEELPALKARLNAAIGADEKESFEDRYEALFSDFLDPYFDENKGARNQLLGSPLPEQSDPRLSAVVATEFAGQPFTSTDWDVHAGRIATAARDWRLLLQIDVADWLQDHGEGTVYFLIRADDLAARRFEAVVPVYQQT